MLPAPARIAAAPMANSRPSCRPAVPPPPVTGASVGYDVVGDGDGLGLGLGLALGEADGLAEGDVEELAEVLVLVLVLVLALVLALVEEVDVEETVAVAVAEPPDGVNTDDGVDPDEQAETPTAPSRIKAPQPTAVSLTLRLTLRAGPAIAARTFIEPPSCGAFPSSRPQKPAREGKRGRPVAAQATIMLSPAGGTNGEWRAQQRNIRLGR